MSISRLSGLLLTLALWATPLWSQHVDRLERERAQVMLHEVASDVREFYYDPGLHGVDWDARLRDAKDKIAKATTREDLFLPTAALLETLEDSQTLFIPPSDPLAEDYDWRFEMIGPHCYVTHVRSKSDAEAKGLKPGDEVLTINGFTATREGLHKIEYALEVLLPQPSLRIVLGDSSGKVRSLDVLARVRQYKTLTDLNNFTGTDAWKVRLERENQRHLIRPRFKEFGKDLLILNLPVLSTKDLDAQAMIDKAREYNSLVIDLRGSRGARYSALQDLLSAAFITRPSRRLPGAPGGSPESTLEYLLSSIFDRDVKIADRLSRGTTVPWIANGDHRKPFGGRLIVLVDSTTASDAELFARIVQIEKRGSVLGDRTSGSAMATNFYGHQMGTDTLFFYGTSVSTAALIMSDGKSLEHVAVTPDETLLLTSADLANDRDPVMAHAAQLAGVPLSPEDAARLFSYEWPMY